MKNNAPSAKPDIIAFDLDGTLFESGTVGRFVAEKAEGIAVTGLDLSHHFYQVAQKVVHAVFPDLSLSSKFKRTLLSQVSKPREGLPEMIDTLRSMDIKLGLVSNNSRHWGERLARHFDFGSGFDAMLFREDTPKGKAKPDPGLLRKLVERLAQDERPETIWYVGDLASDMQAALKAGDESKHIFVPVAMGADSSAALALAERPRETYHIVNSCADLLDRLQKPENNSLAANEPM